MNRRIVAALAAVLLAVVGVVLLTGYVTGADRRAMAGMETTTVLVVTKPVAAGTSSESLAKLVAPRELPVAAVAPGALTGLEKVAGKVTTADLVVGEQLLADRFAAPEAAGGDVVVPDGLHELSVLLEDQRVLGGSLAAGDTVGVFVTTESGQTHLTLHEALVSHVEGGLTPADDEGDADPAAVVVPDGSVMITLALSAADAEKVVWAQERGSIWLSREPAGAPRDGTRIVTEENVFS
ncbi:RcpC/CpaB family pilus assembly protein [Antribacter sp. KLBMP9083]|uniref:RcpC/CpaB family pilus assembly protein n=1 Tax=Antribacter soli TaxID=2910976 RepID=A0AA41QGP1_9MICO|nr:RcpC/CpaB family pilus assembly protein [Antribacter soli]MCF4122812.1 RcpC/CpaB family pilus assembly protein [Antribacter soli]